MKTQIIKIDPLNINYSKISEVSKILSLGGIVAIPTETVYGLAANALESSSVNNIFTAKGRPSDNPLIVHVSDIDSVYPLVTNINQTILNLMNAFWPGPLTIIMEKSDIIPSEVCAGLNTVAIRMPLNSIAQAIISSCKFPLAAPSANTSGRPSPTSANHVIDDLYGKIDAIIDGGPVHVGLESTIIDMTTTPASILRPGAITKNQIKKIICGEIQESYRHSNHTTTPKAPGMKYTHYSPKADVIVVDYKPINDMVSEVSNLAIQYRNKGLNVGLLVTDQTIKLYRHTIANHIISVGNRKKLETIASSLFGMLREFDTLGTDIIIAEAIDATDGIGAAIMDRLNKAAGQKS